MNEKIAEIYNKNFNLNMIGLNSLQSMDLLVGQICSYLK